MDKKPAMMLMLGEAMKKRKGESEPEGDESMMDKHADHLKMIADDMMDAFHAKDSAALADLLGELLDCKDEY